MFAKTQDPLFPTPESRLLLPSTLMAETAPVDAVFASAASAATVAFQCTVCLSPFDDNNHAPRRTPCCRRLLCGKCADVVVSHPTPLPCCFCAVVPNTAIAIASFVVDEGVLECALSATTAPTPYVLLSRLRFVTLSSWPSLG